MDLGQRNKVSVSGSMSAMTDLVFLLLIFFIILSTLASNGVNVDLPSSKSVGSVNSNLTISIKPGEEYFLDGVAIDKADIEGKLVAEMQKQAKKVLYLQVDKTVPTGATVELIGFAKLHEWQVMLGANPKK